MSISPLRLAPILGRSLSILLLAPWLARKLRRRLSPFQSATVGAIARSLQAPPAVALAVYRRSLSVYVKFNINHLFLCRSRPEQIRRKLDHIKVIGADKLGPFLAEGQPVLVITMHMGDFQLGFLKLVSSIRSSRTVSVFKISGNNANEDALFAAFEREAQQLRALRAGEDGGRLAYLELRKGNVVVMTVDLEVNVTSRSVVEFFGQRCLMQNGPASLATLTRATIIPVINFKDAEGVPTVRVESPIDTHPAFPDEGAASIINRVTQQIASTLESWVRIDPFQVHAWTGLAETINHTVASARVES